MDGHSGAFQLQKFRCAPPPIICIKPHKSSSSSIHSSPKSSIFPISLRPFPVAAVGVSSPYCPGPSSIPSPPFSRLPIGPNKPQIDIGQLSRMERLRYMLRTENSLIRELLAEVMGTFLLLLIGISANVQAAFVALVSKGESALAAQLGAQLAWGLGFALAVYSANQISGAHLNPAISLAQLLRGAISPLRFLLYLPAQLLGAFLGSALAFLGHFEDCTRIRQERGAQGLAGLFATYPREDLTSVWSSIADQLLGTAILAASLSLITDRRHRIPSGLVPLLAGLTMTTIALTFGANGGFAINPARDLGPRLFLLCLGMGWDVFSWNNFYFWIPLAIPFVGALVGVILYNLFIGVHGLDEEIEISGAKYPRDDHGYKEYSSNPAAVGPTGGQLVAYSSTLMRNG